MKNFGALKKKTAINYSYYFIGIKSVRKAKLCKLNIINSIASHEN
jgi:hypothetical protein